MLKNFAQNSTFHELIYLAINSIVNFNDILMMQNIYIRT